MKSYTDIQIENLKIVTGKENYLKMQISSVNGRTNWQNITDGQLKQIVEILKQND